MASSAALRSYGTPLSTQKANRHQLEQRVAQADGLFRQLDPAGFFLDGRRTQSEVLTPTRDWIPSVISDFLRAATRDDEKAYDRSLLPQGWSLIEILVRRSIKQNEADPSQAMDKAINSPKGQAIEALIDHALRFCRVSDARAGNHADAWAAMAPLFDEQLAECQNANYEFSTLAGA